jgi:Protein of unknown function (DUF1565)
MRTSLLFAFVSALLVDTVHATDVHVDALLGSDTTGAGTPAAPYRTITKGLQSLGGPGPHAVHVAPGVYDAALGEAFPLVVGTSTSLLGSGPRHTIVSGGGSGTLVRLGRSALVSDFTLRRGSVGAESPPTGTLSLAYVRRCAIMQCGVGVFAYDSIHDDHGVVIVSSAITGGGVGVRAQTAHNDFNSVTVQVYGSTITGNTKAFETVKLFFGFEVYLGLFDSIVRDNADDSISGWQQYVPGTSGNFLAEPSLIGVNGNVNVPPLLVQGSAGDVHLSGTSPVVDFAAPVAPWPPIAQWVPSTAWVWEAAYADVRDIDGGSRVLGTKIDAGADEQWVPALYAWMDPLLGETFELRGVAAPGDLFVLYLGSSLLVPPVGGVGILPPYLPLGAFQCDSLGNGSRQIALPSDPLLAGVDAHLQAARVHAGGIDASNVLSLRLLP